MHTILVADDDSGDVELVRLLFRLSKIGNPIQTACNGDQVIDYLSGRGMYSDRNRYPYPLLCLLDLRMPRCDGFQVLKWLANHPEQTVEIVVLTAMRSEDQSIANRLAEYPYLEKPFSFMKFQELMNEHPNLELNFSQGAFVLKSKTTIGSLAFA